MILGGKKRPKGSNSPTIVLGSDATCRLRHAVKERMKEFVPEGKPFSPKERSLLIIGLVYSRGKRKSKQVVALSKNGRNLFPLKSYGELITQNFI